MAYTKQTWVKGEKISKVKLDHIEDGIEANSTESEQLKANAVRNDIYQTLSDEQKTKARSNIGLNFMEGDQRWTDAQKRTALRMLSVANLAALYSPTKTDYGLGDCVVYEDGYYVFIHEWPNGVSSALGAWDWDKVEATGNLSATKYWRWVPVNPQMVLYSWQDLTLAQKTQARMNLNVGNLAAEYNPSKSDYAAGDCVIYQSAYYRCILSMNSAAGVWDWDKVSGVGDLTTTKYWEGIAVTPEMISYGAQALTVSQKNKARQNINANSIGVEPEWFGAKGDGVTNDTRAIQYAFGFAEENGLPISFQAGKVYAVSGYNPDYPDDPTKRIYPYISKRINVYGNGATLKALDSMLCCLEIWSEEGQPPSLPGMGLVENLTFDCNGQANIGLHVGRAQGWQVQNIDIRTPKICGLHVDGSYEIFVNSLRVAGADPYVSGATYPAGWRTISAGKLYENTSGASTSSDISNSSVWTELGSIDSANTVGVKIYNNDSHYTDIVTKNVGIGVQVGHPEGWGGGANFLTRIHSWNTDPAIVPTSIMFDIYNSAILTDCYCDTCMVGMKLNNAVFVDLKGMYILHGGSTVGYMRPAVVGNAVPEVFRIPQASYAAKIRAIGVSYLNPTARVVLNEGTINEEVITETNIYKLFNLDTGEYSSEFPWAKLNDASLQVMTYFPETSENQSVLSRLSSIEANIADILYEAIAISSFTVSPSTAEMGSTVSSATLAYSLNKVPESATLDGNSQTIENVSGTIGLTGLSLTANKTWTLAVTDAREATATKTATLSFLNRVYYGAASAPGTINSTFLLGLTGSVLTGSKSRTITENAGSGKYIWYAVPSRFGACSFNVGGFDGGFTKVSTFSHTNASGYSENYDVYRSDNAGLGSTTVKVT